MNESFTLRGLSNNGKNFGDPNNKLYPSSQNNNLEDTRRESIKKSMIELSENKIPRLNSFDEFDN